MKDDKWWDQIINIKFINFFKPRAPILTFNKHKWENRRGLLWKREGNEMWYDLRWWSN